MHTLELSLTLAKAQFKLQNEGSLFGILWYILTPLATFIILLAVFSRILGSNIENYPVYLLLGIILFNVFRQTTLESTRVMYQNRMLLKSANFNHRALVLATVFRVFFSHIFEIAIFFIVASYFNLSSMGIFYYPLILVIFMTFNYGIALFLSAISVYLLDIGNIWGAFTQALWFATPIFYMIGENKWHLMFNEFNPIAHVINIARELLIQGSVPQLRTFVIMILFAIISYIVGEFSFRKATPKFAERF